MLVQPGSLQQTTIYSNYSAYKRSPDHWKFSKAYSGSRFAHGFETSVYICTYDYITKLCGQQAEVVRNHENANVRNMGQGENIRGLNLAAVKHTTVQVTRLPL
jgi:hypothetical protein